MMSNRERMDFVIWATPLFPDFTLSPSQYARALVEWSTEKRIRQLEAEGITRSDAQGIVEAETM